MAQGKDKFFDARLVEEARTHLATILSGAYSEQFFYCFFKIIERKTYLGYYTFQNRQIELKGIIDFIHNKHYGFGLHGLDRFYLALCDVMIYDETESQYARQTIKWLKTQSPKFKLPRKAFEFERLLSWIRYRRSISKVTNREIRIFIELYNVYPDYLQQIGEGRQFRTFEQAGIAAGFIEPRRDKSIKFNIDMTDQEMLDAATRVYGMLGPTKNCRFIEHLIQLQKNDTKVSDDTRDEDYEDIGEQQDVTTSLCDRIREGDNDGPGG